MRALGLLFCLASLLPAQLRNADFDIRFEPVAKLQTHAQIPYRIAVKDALGKPVAHAQVTLEIETTDHKSAQTYKAPMVEPGVYMAKPTFDHSGQWNVIVNVLRDQETNGRTIEYSVPD